MTTHEAKDKLYMQWQEFLEYNIDYAGISDAYKMAFKALEQMDVLDKLRAEIEAYQSDAFYSDDVMMNKRTVLEIIDKYRNEVSE